MLKDIGLPKGNDTQEKYWLYMLSNSKPNGPLYLGETLCLYSRMKEHHAGTRRDFAHYHRMERLIYFEVWNDHEKYLARMRRVRNWPRDMRLMLIESLNPEWIDLLPAAIDNNPAYVVIVHTECSFLKELKAPGVVEIKVLAGEVGRSSLVQKYEMRRTDTPEVLVATGSAKMVWVSPETGRSTPIPDRFLRILNQG